MILVQLWLLDATLILWKFMSITLAHHCGIETSGTRLTRHWELSWDNSLLVCLKLIFWIMLVQVGKQASRLSLNESLKDKGIGTKGAGMKYASDHIHPGVDTVECNWEGLE